MYIPTVHAGRVSFFSQRVLMAVYSTLAFGTARTSGVVARVGLSPGPIDYGVIHARGMCSSEYADVPAPTDSAAVP
jgi:hypothetical protein